MDAIRQHESWMRRCFDLAARGRGYVSPNPTVGAVLVHDGRLLGEGYHRRYGGPHAEVEAIASVPDSERHLIPNSTLYVSLEPCCITGKTPPCTDLIRQEGIGKVVVSTTDPNPKVAGKGLSFLREYGVDTTTGVLEEEGRRLIRPFAVNILERRPYITLKWAQSPTGHYGVPGRQTWLSEPSTRTWSHRLRAETDAILVGARTVRTDDPSLTTRDYPGRSPHRVIYDPSGNLPFDSKAFARGPERVLYVTHELDDRSFPTHLEIIRLPMSGSPLHALVADLYNYEIGQLLVEGGAYLQKQFILERLWDEAWVIRTRADLTSGIEAPRVTGRLAEVIRTGTDEIIGMYREDLA